MPDFSRLLEGLEQHLIQQRKDADAACICKFCGSKRKPSEYKPNNKYHCHNCSAEWPTLFDNHFWREYCGDLYDQTRKSLSLSRK